MQYTIPATIPYSADKVLHVFMDEMKEVIPYLPSISKLETLSREETPEGIKFHHRWYGDGKISSGLDRFIKKEYLAWNDYALWKPDERRCEWHQTSIKPEGLMDSRGHTTIEVLDDASCKLTISGDLHLYPEKAVMRFLAPAARAARPQIEKLFLSIITNDMKQMAPSITRFLDDTKKKL